MPMISSVDIGGLGAGVQNRHLKKNAILCDVVCEETGKVLTELEQATERHTLEAEGFDVRWSPDGVISLINSCSLSRKGGEEGEEERTANCSLNYYEDATSKQLRCQVVLSSDIDVKEGDTPFELLLAYFHDDAAAAGKAKKKKKLPSFQENELLKTIVGKVVKAAWDTEQ